ncbi:MAG: PIN domain-containing protein [Bacteroidota bacterium]|nr:PIN domain nuclease [Odoribacter sp.]MDP3644291.1 PIN domain-containing protein [Bacteroidota bacterium]
MKVIVDANIVFSAILNTNSKIADLLLNSKGIFEFLAPDFLLTETIKYHKKISSISKMTLTEVVSVENKVTKPISFLSGIHIPQSKWLNAEQLVSDIDSKDTPYLAFSMFFKCKIWSGDKVLRNGLIQKGFHNVITTEELFEMREMKRKK